MMINNDKFHLKYFKLVVGWFLVPFLALGTVTENREGISVPVPLPVFGYQCRFSVPMSVLGIHFGFCYQCRFSFLVPFGLQAICLSDCLIRHTCTYTNNYYLVKYVPL